MLIGDVRILLNSLEGKFQDPVYERLHWVAFNEVRSENFVVIPH